MTVETSTPTRTGERPDHLNQPVRRRQPHEPPSLNETANDALECFQHYAKERPGVVAMCCLGVGFVLGWKLKPW